MNAAQRTHEKENKWNHSKSNPFTIYTKGCPMSLTELTRVCKRVCVCVC